MEEEFKDRFDNKVNNLNLLTCEITAHVSNGEEGGSNDIGIGKINYTNNNAGDFNTYFDNLYNSILSFIKKVASANELRLGGEFYVIKGYSLKFLRSDSTVIDEIKITDETIDGVKEIITAFYTI